MVRHARDVSASPSEYSRFLVYRIVEMCADSLSMYSEDNLH